MTDLNEFRAALRAPDPEQRSLDIAQIMTKGARVRRRRRFAVGATSGLAVVALLVGGSQVAGLTARWPGVPGISIGAAGPVRPEIDGQLGEVIDTGIPANGGKWVLYGLTVEDAALPQTAFGVMLGRRLTTGALTKDVMANESEGSDRVPGFHAVSGSMDIDGGTTPLFGYYAGSPALITGIAGGRKVTAEQAVWSEDPNVVVFWFDPADVPKKAKIKDIAAYDGAGNELPAGNNSIGVG
jgi:hypothetical protein